MSLIAQNAFRVGASLTTLQADTLRAYVLWPTTRRDAYAVKCAIVTRHANTTTSNLAITYQCLRRLEEALRLRRDVYSGWLKLNGEEYLSTLIAANNYAQSLVDLQSFKEVKSLLRRILPVARRVLRESHELTLKMRQNYVMALYRDKCATLDDLREAVTTIEDTARIARRVFGGAHPTTTGIEAVLREAQAALRSRTE